MNASPVPRGWVAGIDFGTVRIGIAVADLEVKIASPLDNYTRRTPELDAEYFRRFVREERVIKFVVGLPVHLDGRESQKSREARTFGAWLTETTGVPVVYFDERFTSSEALQKLSAQKMTKKQRQARLDKLAAQIMLAAYLENPNRASETPAGLD